MSLAGIVASAFGAPPGTILPAGTLPVLRNIQSGISGITTNGSVMSITQNQRAAIINWNQFNIARGSRVEFLQPDAGARVLNRIFDSDPSIIQGQLSANGQVLLLNRNGILFDRGSQINVGTLYASTLNITDADFNKGFAASAQGSDTNPFTRFDLFKDASGNPLPSGPILVNVHGPATDASGAAVPPATLASASQGAIVLIAPAIDNRGVIVSPDGQVILAAGKTAYLWQRNTDTTGDPRAGALRGMMVEITAGADNLNVSNLVANSVTNSGTILADRGNISVAALAINQKGIVSAGSSVVSNGSVWLTARSIPDTPYINDASGNSVAKLGDSDAGRPAERLGSVLFGAGSFTGTPLLTDSGRLSQSDSYSNFQATTVGNNNSVQTFSRDFRSWVHVVGNTIQNQGTVQSPGGVMELLAQGYTDPVTSQFVAPRILLEAGSTVSAAGDWVDKSVADNIVQIQRLTSNDLKDSPLQRSGANSLVGTSVAVDLRQPNALFSLQPYIDNQQNTVQDKATAGGDIRIEARQGEVISAPGSVIDVSGGGFRYAAGSYTTTRLLGTDAKAYSLCASGPTCASPLRTYSGTADAITTKFFKAGPLGWNLSRSYATLYKSNPTSESAYLKGADAGTLSIVAPRIAALGDWRGGVSLGRYQVNQDKASATPRAGTLTIGDVSGVAGGAVDFGIDRISFGAATALPVGFGLGSALPADASGAGLVLPADQYRFAGLAAESFAYQGFGNLALFANGKVTVPAGTGVLLPPGGTFSARTSAGTGIIELGAAQDGRDGGSITAPAGRVSLASDTVRLGGAQWSLDGSLVSPGARIDAGGLVSADARMSKDLPAGGGFTARSAGNLTEYVTNNIGALLDDLSTASGRPSGAVVAPAFAVNAASGSITLSGRAVDLERGSSLSAMGGLKVAANNAVTAGNGGSIAITANAGVTSVTDPSGSLRMDGDLYGYALGTGATLQVQSRSMRVTDSEAGGAPIGPGNVGGDPATGDLKLAPGFFRTGGFTGYTLTGQAGMDIDPGIQLRPQAQALQVGVLSLDRSQRLAASGTTRLSSGSGDGAVAASLSVRDVVVDYEAGRIEARPATSLAFKLAPNNAYPGVGSLTLGAGASIVADPGAKVSFEFSPLAGTALPDSKGIELLGSVKAPGGTISATVSYPALQSGATLAQFDPAHPDNDRQSGLVHVGPGSTLSTKAVFVSQVGGSNAFGNVRASDGSVGKGLRTQGSVTSGGAIALSATNARVNIDAGSLLDVSAAAATVDLPELANAAGPSIFAPQTIWGDAGSISVSSTDASRLAGTMNAQAAGQGSGGSFALNFVRATPFGDPLLARSITDHRVVLTAGAPDSNERTQLGANAFSTARVSANALGAAGFSSVAIKSDNSIELSGSLNLRPSLSLTLDAPVLDVRGSGTPLVQLSTNRLTLMNSTGNTVRANFNPAVPGGPVATSSGNGILFANGRLVDLIGTVTINGVNGDEDPATGDKVRSLVINSSGDLRLTGLPVKLGRTTNADQTVDALVGALNSQADIELRAQQVYPTSMSEFTLSSQSVIGGVGTNSGTVRIAQVPGTPGPVVSAGGKLFLQGSAVEQSGTLKAPLGRIELNADSVQLNTGSLTSVSLLDGSAGQTVPFGETLNGRSWYYDLSPVATAGTVNPNASLTLTSPGEKKIVAKGATVSIAPGAVVDLRGGGDVQAFEFVPGPGGSKDVLQSTASNQTWAVLPSMRLADAPLDTHLAARSGVATTAAPGTYNTIFLKGVKGVADGFYPLLDAHYALLPGALQVTKVTGSAAAAYADLPAGPGKSLLDKTQVISTWRGVAGSPVREARTAGYIVQSGEAARTASQLDTNSSAFFAATAGDNPVPRLPADAGNLALLPTASLTLLGDLKTGAASGGLGAQVDISANSIKVVDSVDPAAPADPAFVTLGADVLNRLSGSLLLGGTRSGALLTANAQKVVVANSAAQPLALSEVLIAARDTVDVQAGAVIDATAAGLSGSAAIAAGNKGALLRASSGVQVEVSRGSSVDTSGGILNVSGTVRAPSVIFDATRNTTFDGVLQQAKSFSVSAGAVAIGDTGNFKPGGSAFAGLALNADRLNSFSTLDALSIRSYSSIALVGASTVGSKALASLALDAGEIAGFQARDATGSALARLDAAGAPLPTVLSASTVTLRNSSASPRGTGTPDGTAKLKLESDRLVLGAGDKGLRGFSAVNAVAATELAESGTGTLTVASGMRVSAPRLVGSAGADQGISAASYDGATQFALTVDPDAATAGGVPATSATTGGRWALAGKSVSFSTAIDAPSGTVEIAARGAGPSDGVTLGSGAVVGVAGVTRSFT
ncbi:MAG: filamentous hemagglutinin N-terminal domain-containing protein, partial [Betaproteobacteria bacterium]